MSTTATAGSLCLGLSTKYIRRPSDDHFGVVAKSAETCHLPAFVSGNVRNVDLGCTRLIRHVGEPPPVW
jgi:hypothetical protein